MNVSENVYEDIKVLLTYCISLIVTFQWHHSFTLKWVHKFLGSSSFPPKIGNKIVCPLTDHRTMSQEVHYTPLDFSRGEG